MRLPKVQQDRALTQWYRGRYDAASLLICGIQRAKPVRRMSAKAAHLTGPTVIITRFSIAGRLKGLSATAQIAAHTCNGDVPDGLRAPQKPPFPALGLQKMHSCCPQMAPKPSDPPRHGCAAATVPARLPWGEPLQKQRPLLASHRTTPEATKQQVSSVCRDAAAGALLSPGSTGSPRQTGQSTPRAICAPLQGLNRAVSTT